MVGDRIFRILLLLAVQALDKDLTFADHDKFGHLPFCPTNLGSTLRASVHIRIPGVSERPDFKDICNKYGLQPRGTPLERAAKKIQADKKCHSLMKKHLTPDVVKKYLDTETSLGGTLLDCIQSGHDNPDSSVGVYACDPEAYTTFSDMLDPVIKEYHKVDGDITHPTPTFGDLANLSFGDLDPENVQVVSTRVRVGRSLAGFPFPPVITKEQRLKIESKAKEALESLTGELKGTYHPLTDMDSAMQKRLTEDHFLFNDHDRFLKAAGGYRDWPSGRGIFFNDDKTFLVWVNEEDHLRIISMQKGGNLGAVYTRLVNAINALEKKLTFAKEDRLGYVTFCPTNLGTTLRASVHARIPNLACQKDFKQICDNLNIQARGIDGEHTKSVGGVYDLSNKRRLGLTEYDAVQEMANGVKDILEQEKTAKPPSKSCTLV